MAKGPEGGPLCNREYDEDCWEKEMCRRDTIDLCIKHWAQPSTGLNLRCLCRNLTKNKILKTWRTAIVVDHCPGLSHGHGWSQKLWLPISLPVHMEHSPTHILSYKTNKKLRKIQIIQSIFSEYNVIKLEIKQ